MKDKGKKTGGGARDPEQGEALGELLKRVFGAVAEFSNGRDQHDDMAAAMFHFLG